MKRNKFSLSHHRLFTCDMGQLVPCGLLEVLPGDSLQQATIALVRCSPLVSPPMHPVEVRLHHWYVPLRLIWEDFEDFITGGPDGMDDSVYPTVAMPASVGAAVSSLADYLGVPTGVADLAVSALPFRAYGLIFNEWYRDQDLVSPVVVSDASGVDTTTSTALQLIAWEKDYFTSARPWEQKGPSISIPLTGDAPVEVDYSSGNPGLVMKADGTPMGSNQALWELGNNFNLSNSSNPAVYDPNGSLFADLSGVSAVTVNALREALALQRFEEARARYGSRYTEYLRYLGVKSSDARLQRPEYLGGGKQMIQFSEVLQTSANVADNPLGQMGGHGISAMRSNRYRRFFEEHGYVLTLMSVRPKTLYIDGLKRTWNRRTKEDFFQRELEHIGQQEVANKEVYAAHTTPDGTFGYQDRYDEYRREESYISGEFRTTLDTWHFGRAFSSDPALNSSFVQCVPPEEPFADQTDNVLWIMARHSVQARRLLSPRGSSFIF